MEQGSSRGERTRAEILRAAYTLFLKNGFHGTSMRQIAQEAGIAVGGIYNHFSGKEDIFVSVLLKHHPIQSVLPMLQTAQGDTVEKFVHDVAARLAAGIGDKLEFIHLLFIELVEFKGSHIPQLYTIIFPQGLEFARRFAEKREELRPIPIALLVRAFIGLFISYVMTELMVAKQQTREIQENALDYFVDIYLHGILKEDC